MILPATWLPGRAGCGEVPMARMMQRNGGRASRIRLGRGAGGGALLRLLFFHLRPTVAGDALMYGDLAHNMVAHHVYGFSATVIQPTLIRLPGYPLFLAACFAVFGGDANYAAVLWVQMVVDLAGCALLGVLAERLCGTAGGVDGGLAGGALSVYGELCGGGAG